MPDEQRIPDPACDEARIDWAILNLLIDGDDQRPWSIEEVIHEHGNQRDALDGLDRLHGKGLIHRIDGFIFATRAAVHRTYMGGIERGERNLTLKSLERIAELVGVDPLVLLRSDSPTATTSSR
jgi:hypothetical protein